MCRYTEIFSFACLGVIFDFGGACLTCTDSRVTVVHITRREMHTTPQTRLFNKVSKFFCKSWPEIQPYLFERSLLLTGILCFRGTKKMPIRFLKSMICQ